MHFRSSPRRLPFRIPREQRYSSSSSFVNVRSVQAPATGSIKVLSLSRPAARNAISRALLAELRSHIDSIAAEYDDAGNELLGQAGGATRALIIASEVDGAFCAGADLKERRGMSSDETAAFLLSLRQTLSKISALPIPTLSSISSLALGGGLELALSTTFRVFSSRAVVALPETRLGIIPGAGGTYRLPALIGRSRARDMILTGRRVGAMEALGLGLCDRVVEIPEPGDGDQGGEGREMVLGAAIELAKEICQGGPVAVRMALRAVNGAKDGLGEELENKCYERVVRTEDRNEALKAFGEKRRPVFTGR